MFPPIQRKLTDKMVDDLRHEHQQAITEIAFFQGLLHNGWGVFFLRWGIKLNFRLINTFFGGIMP